MTSTARRLSAGAAEGRLARMAASFVPTGVRQGWSVALASLVTAAVTTWLVVDNGGAGNWLATRGAGIGLVLIALALVVGSTELVGAAGLPMLGGAAIGMAGGERYDWGSALLIGLAWYLAAELAWASIEARRVELGPGRKPEARIDQRALRRIGEVATVMAATVLVSLMAVTLAGVAPARTLLVKSASVAVVVAGLLVVGRRLTASGSPTTR